MKSLAVLNVLCSVWLIASAAEEGGNKTISRHPEDNEIDIGDVKEVLSTDSEILPLKDVKNSNFCYFRAAYI